MTSKRTLTAAAAILLALILLTASIAAPILFRGFYYAHIDALELPRLTGLADNEIRTAYDEMLDYCLGLREDFSTGVLRWSESGKDHFDDVRALFLLDLRVLAVSAALLIVLFAVMGKKKLRFAPVRGRGPLFWAACAVGVPFVLVGALAAMDFDRAFVVFHSLFFPGKSNWIFDPAADEIILILPQIFFRNCAIAILALLLTGCALFVLADIRLRARALIHSA